MSIDVIDKVVVKSSITYSGSCGDKSRIVFLE